MLPMPTAPVTADPTVPTAPILVVDDDAKIVRLVRTYLEREGYRVVTATDGPAALDAIETHEPALVVLDLMLPELDGRAVIRAVRRDEAAGRTPILVLSARSLDDRPDRRSRGWRRRLPAQAVLAGRARPAREVDPAPDHDHRSACRHGDARRADGSRARAGHPPRRPDRRPVAPRGPPRRRRGHRPDPGRVPAAPGASSRPTAGSCRATSCSTPSTATRRPRSSTARSTSTSAACATSSTTTPTRRATSRPSAASATGRRGT